MSAEGSAATGDLEILLGNGDGTFQPPLEIASGTFQLIAAGDLNQDGVTDIFTSGYPSGGAIFLSGPIATLSASYLSFGAVGLSSTSPAQSLMLSNSGNGPLELSGISLLPPFAATNDCGSSVAISSSCTISVTFTANTLGNLTGNISIVDNAPLGQQSIPLFGTGVVDFSITPTSTSLTMHPGGQATDVMTFIGIGGPFGNAIQLTCAVSGPSPLPICSMSSSSVTPGANSVTSTLMVTAPTATAMQMPVGTRRFAGFLLATFVPLMFGMCFVNRLLARLRMHLLLFSLLLFLLLMSACGGSNTDHTVGTGSTYTVTVTAASGAINHTTQVTVIVN